MYVEVEYPESEFLGDLRAGYRVLEGVFFEDGLGVSARRMRQELRFYLAASRSEGGAAPRWAPLPSASPVP